MTVGLWYLRPDFLAYAWTVAALLLVFAVALGWRDARSRSVREGYIDLVRRFSGDFSVRYSAEEAARNFLAFVLNIIMPMKTRESVGMRLSMAGHSGAAPMKEFEKWKLIGLVGGVTLAIFGYTAGLMPLLFAIGLILATFFGPDLWLMRQISARTKRIGFQLPEALDLLTLCVRAGLGFSAGLQEVARVQKGAVAAEFSRVLQEMQFGMSRIDAFTALAERTKQPDLMRFSHAMIRADQAGITVGDMLAEQARSMREARQALAREKAQQVSVKILFPLLACFLPGVFMVVLGPAVLNLMGMFR